MTFLNTQTFFAKVQRIEQTLYLTAHLFSQASFLHPTKQSLELQADFHHPRKLLFFSGRLSSPNRTIAGIADYARHMPGWSNQFNTFAG